MKLAALGSDGWWEEGRDWPITIAWENVEPTIRWWLAGMRRHEVQLLYVHASALEFLGLPTSIEPPLPGERRPRHPWLDCTFEQQRPSHLALSPSITCGELEVMIGAYQDSGAPFDDCADAHELVAAALAFRDAFRVPKVRPHGWALRNSPILTGCQLMHAPWTRGARKAKLEHLAEHPRPELEGVGEGEQVEVPYGSRWAREHNLAPHGGCEQPWVSAWDINGQRLAACSRLSLGVGGLEHRGPTPTVHFDPKLPGYHLIKSVGDPFPGYIPPIFEPGWHTTPRVAMAAYLGLELEIADSWVWTEHVPYLNPFYDAYRGARAQLLEKLAVYQGAHGPNVGHMPGALHAALGALKQSYLGALGRLRSARERENHSPLYRPDWYDHVIGQELAREYMRLHQLAEELPGQVLAVYFDTIICEVPTPEHQPTALEVSSQLGKFRHLGTVPQTEAHAALYGGERNPDVGALVKVLKAAGPAPSDPLYGGGAGHTAPGAPAALSAFTRPTHGGYPPPIAPADALVRLALEGVRL